MKNKISVGDKIKLKRTMGVFNNIGEVCTVQNVSQDGIISFKFGGAHLGCMSYEELDKYFDVLPKEIQLKAISATDIQMLMDGAKTDIVSAHGKAIIVSMKLKSGFVITDSVACVNPNDYDEDFAIKKCMKKIETRIAELEAYRRVQNAYEQSVQHS